MNVLFICRHNRFRSKIAEAYFKKINKNKKIEVKSAGIFPGSYPLEKLQVKTAKELAGVKIKGKPKPITTDLLKWKDLIVAVTDDLPNGLFNYGPFKAKVEKWEIPDEMKGSEKATEKIVKEIMFKVENLVKKLEDER